jgi:hypothetical protein
VARLRAASARGHAGDRPHRRVRLQAPRLGFELRPSRGAG